MNSVLSNRTTVKRPRRELGLLLTTMVLVSSAPLALGKTDLTELEFRHGIAFFHDLKYPADFEHLDFVNPDAPKGGKLVLPTQVSFNTLTPGTSQTTTAPGINWTFDTLLIRAGDEVSGFYGRLANGIAITPDERVIVIRIHPDARWHDGVPVTSADVVFSLDYMLARIELADYYEFAKDVEQIDARHLAIHLSEPLTLSNAIVLQHMQVMPAHYWRERDPRRASLSPPLSSGPYRVSAVSQGRYVEYERVPDYWGRDIPVNQGRYNFEHVRYEVYRDATATREALRKGLIDIWTEQDVRYWHSAFDTPAAEKGRLKKIRRNFGFEIGIRRALAFNNRLGKFKDRRVRQALTLAMDFEWQNRTLHFGHRTRAQSYWQDTPLQATGLPSEDELVLLEPIRDQLPPELFTQPFRFAEVKNQAQHRANMLRARQLLIEAGWRVVDGVLRNAEGEPFEMTFLSQNPEDARTLLPFFEQLDQLGIQADIRLAETSQYINRLRNYQFDAMLRNGDIMMPPMIELRSTYHTQSVMQPLSRNQPGIGLPVLDYLVDKAEAARTMSEIVAVCRAIDRVLLWHYFQIPVYKVDRPRTVYWDRFGVPDLQPHYLPAFPDGWWFDPQKAARIRLEDE